MYTHLGNGSNPINKLATRMRESQTRHCAKVPELRVRNGPFKETIIFHSK